MPAADRQTDAWTKLLTMQYRALHGCDK